MDLVSDIPTDVNISIAKFPRKAPLEQWKWLQAGPMSIPRRPLRGAQRNLPESPSAFRRPGTTKKAEKARENSRDPNQT